MFQHLPAYATDCSALYPPSELCLPVPSEVLPTEIPLTYKSYSANRLVSTSTGDNATPEVIVSEVPSLPPGSQLNAFKPSDKFTTSPPDGTLCIQWSVSCEKVQQYHYT